MFFNSFVMGNSGASYAVEGTLHAFCGAGSGRGCRGETAELRVNYLIVFFKLDGERSEN